MAKCNTCQKEVHELVDMCYECVKAKNGGEFQTLTYHESLTYTPKQKTLAEILKEQISTREVK